MKDVVAVILAGGRGTRMHTAMNKSLHRVGDRAIIDWLLDACQLASIEHIIVVTGPGSTDLREHLARDGHALEICIAVQDEPQGTGDAVRAALPRLREIGARHAIILPGDMPNLQPSTLKRFMGKRTLTSMACMTVMRDDPAAYGRIVRKGEDLIEKIVEFKDCSAEEIAIREVNAGVYNIPSAMLDKLIPLLTNDNAAAEYYLTDIVALANEHGAEVQAVLINDPGEVMGVNTQEELARATAWRKKLSS